jgi:hypothetical protein
MDYCSHNRLYITVYSVNQYLKLLYESSANLLSFTGLTAQTVFAAVDQQKQARLSSYQKTQE